MIQEAISYVYGLGGKSKPVEILDFDGRKYTDRELKEVKLPSKEPLRIGTLSSLRSLCTGTFGGALFGTDVAKESGFEGFNADKHVVHVVSPMQVQVVTAQSNVWARREVLIDCNLPETTPFPLSTPKDQKWLAQDEFIIAALSAFVPTTTLKDITRLAGNATSEKVVTAQDDGVTQIIGTKAGAHLADQVSVKNIVSLQLYRTFREVEQPASDFLFRLKQSGENVPMFAFFEADGGAWKLTAVDRVATYLRAGMAGATIVS